MSSLNLFAACMLVTLALAGCSATPSVPQAAPLNNPAGSSQPATANTGANQGIAVGEPAPGTQPSSTTAILTPCRRAFLNEDSNGDGWIDAAEWAKANGSDSTAQAEFKAKDADGNGQLDNGEFGCQDTAPNGGQPSGRG